MNCFSLICSVPPHLSNLCSCHIEVTSWSSNLGNYAPVTAVPRRCYLCQSGWPPDGHSRKNSTRADLPWLRCLAGGDGIRVAAYDARIRRFTFAFGFGFGAGPCTGATLRSGRTSCFRWHLEAVTATPQHDSIGWTQKTLHTSGKLTVLRFWQEQQPSPVDEIGRSIL